MNYCGKSLLMRFNWMHNWIKLTSRSLLFHRGYTILIVSCNIVYCVVYMCLINNIDNVMYRIIKHMTLFQNDNVQENI